MNLPNPGMNFDPLTPLPAESLDNLVENIEALSAGTGFAAGAIPAAALDANANPETRMKESLSNFVASGGVASFTATTLNGAFTSGVAYINGQRQLFNSLNYTAAANKDRYFYITLGNATIQAAADVANNAASPALPANSIWLDVTASGASAITSIRQVGTDSNGKVIYPNMLTGLQPDWTVMALLNSWINYDAAFNTARYMKDAMGFVHLQGMVKSGVMGATVFVLPAGFRPSKVCYFAAVSNTGLGVISVDSNGIIKFDGGGNGYMSFDLITFKAER
jgi:hypothetical protein